MTVARVRKALTAALAAGFAAAIAAYPGGFTQAEVGKVLIAASVAGYAVYKVKNVEGLELP